MTLGEAIKYYRQKLNMTQDELALKLNTTPQNVYKYEKGVITNVPLSVVTDIADIFDISAGHLLGWEFGDTPELSMEIIANRISNAKSTLAIRFNEKRVESGLSLEAISYVFCMSIEEVSRYENMDYDLIDFKTLCKLALIARTTTDYLLGLSDDYTITSYSLSDIETRFIYTYNSFKELHSHFHEFIEQSSIPDIFEKEEPDDFYQEIDPYSDDENDSKKIVLNSPTFNFYNESH